MHSVISLSDSRFNYNGYKLGMHQHIYIMLLLGHVAALSDPSLLLLKSWCKKSAGCSFSWDAWNIWELCSEPGPVLPNFIFRNTISGSC